MQAGTAKRNWEHACRSTSESSMSGSGRSVQVRPIGCRPLTRQKGAPAEADVWAFQEGEVMHGIGSSAS